MISLYDSHSHLDSPAFDADRSQVLARARAAGVARQLVPAVRQAAWPGLRALCAAEAGLRPAYGLHPMFLPDHRPHHLDELGQWLAAERPAAVGEIGLDHFLPGLDPDEQRRYFHGQLALAREFDLPVVLHARRAVDEVIAALRRVGGLRGVVHSWSGSQEQAEQLFRMDFCLGVGAPLGFERAQRLRQTVATMPLQFLLLETDAPDQPGPGHRGQRNEPCYLGEVLAVVAQLRGQTPESVALATTANATALFGD